MPIKRSLDSEKRALIDDMPWRNVEQVVVCVEEWYLGGSKRREMGEETKLALAVNAIGRPRTGIGRSLWPIPRSPNWISQVNERTVR